MNQRTDPAQPRLSHARDYTRPGFYVKLVLMALVNAFGLYGIMVSIPQQQWLVLGFLAVTLLVADYVYFSKRVTTIPNNRPSPRFSRPPTAGSGIPPPIP